MKPRCKLLRLSRGSEPTLLAVKDANTHRSRLREPELQYRPIMSGNRSTRPVNDSPFSSKAFVAKLKCATILSLDVSFTLVSTALSFGANTWAGEVQFTN